MKKIIIIGSGTSGLMTAAVFKRFFAGRVKVEVYYDSKRKTIGVGESTTQAFVDFIRRYLHIHPADFIKDTGSTVKLGILFKNWTKNKEYFHGFNECNLDNSRGEYPESLHSIPNGTFNGGTLYNKATTTVPSHDFYYNHAVHIDTQLITKYILDDIKDEIDHIDDVVEKVNSDGKSIQSIVFKNKGEVTADFYVDASGFSNVLFKHLNPDWVDITNYLPLDRAIPQQIPHNLVEIPSYTQAEATKDGWIWQIPLKKRYGTGYVYSSKFTTDEEAKKNYNEWLKKNHGVELNEDPRIIHYKPGYYKKNWIGNCLSVGLASGFIEPLESTGLQILYNQIQFFVKNNTTLKFLEFDRRNYNNFNEESYVDIFNFICLHYNTNRTDSPFWQYMTNNKTDWMKAYEEKCSLEFIPSGITDEDSQFHIDSYMQVSEGLGMVNVDAVNEFLKNLPKAKSLVEDSKSLHEILEKIKNKKRYVPHRSVLNGSVIIKK